jgi:serine/threonine protein kinase
MDSSSPYCPECGALNAPDAVTCFACGRAVPARDLEVTAGGTTGALSVGGPLMRGSLLRQRYRILTRIGEGGFGAVYKAEDTELGNRQVAIKEMQPRSLATQELQEATEAFHREALLLAGLSHPSLPRIYEHFSEGGNWYLVMDFIKGETLESALARRGGRFPVGEALQLGIKLCRVLEYLHSRQPPIIFRDLKPANVLLEPNGQVYLVDFGIARLFKPGQSKDTMAFGSPGYAAPEQYGKAQTTPRSDIYSLGALLYQLLGGHDPSETPFRFAPLTVPLPAGTWELIQRMVNLDEYRRPETMAAVRQELERLEIAWAGGKQIARPSTGYLGQPTSAYPAVASARMSPPLQPVAMQTAAPASAGVPQRSKKRTGWGCLVLVVGILFFSMTAFHHSSSVTVDGSSSSGNGSTGSGSGPVDAAIWSPDGKYLAETIGQLVEVRDAVSGNVMATHQEESSYPDWLAWSPDSTRIASANEDGTASVWDAVTGKPIATFRGGTRRVSELSWSPDGTRVVSASDDGTVHIWDATSGTNLFTYTQHAGRVWTVAWSPDGKWIASGSEDQTVQVWDAQTGQTRLTYSGHTGGIGHLSWSPDGTRIASASQDGTVQVWDTATGTTLATYSNHRSNSNAVAWSPDGTYVVSGSTDDTVDVWTVTPLQEVFVRSGPGSQVESVSWSPDGKRIACSGDTGTVQIWDALTGNNIQTFQG